MPEAFPLVAIEPMQRGIIVWSARWMVACYFGAVWLRLLKFPRRNPGRWAEQLWLMGCLALSLHAVTAWLWIDHASWAAAWARTREETRLVTGWATGIGLPINGLVLALWWLDVVWVIGDDPARSRRRYRMIVTWLLAFMLWQATAIFGPAGWGPVFAGLVAVTIGGWWWGRANGGDGKSPRSLTGG
jgi:hypothetical protein